MGRAVLCCVTWLKMVFGPWPSTGSKSLRRTPASSFQAAWAFDAHFGM